MHFATTSTSTIVIYYLNSIIIVIVYFNACNVIELLPGGPGAEKRSDWESLQHISSCLFPFSFKSLKRKTGWGI